MKRALLLAALLASVLAAGLPPRALAQGGPSVIGTTRLPLSEDTKYPHVAVRGGEVLVASSAEETFARLWAKPLAAVSFPNPATMGLTSGKPDNASAAIFTSHTGATHYAWINQQERRVYLRTRGPGEADFGPARVVTGTAPDPVEVEVAANEDGVFVFWRNVAGPISYRRSADGVNWSVPTLNVIAETVEPIIDIAAGAGRRLAVAYYRGRVENDDSYLQGYLAIWNGASFTNERIPAQATRDFATPQVALRPDGGYAITMRGVATLSGEGAGLYVADRSPSGVWSGVDRLARGVTTSSAIESDAFGNIHLYFISTESGGFGLYYTFRRPGQGYGGGAPNTPPATLLPVFTRSLFVSNVRAAAEVRDRSYSHAASEIFQGGDSFAQYYQVGLPVEINSAESISIEGGAAATNKSTVSLTFNGVTGPATGVRWSWGAPPAAGAPYAAFDRASPTISVPLPADIPAGCPALTLYTQLRGPAAEQVGTNSASIVVDRAVQAEFFVTGAAPAIDPRYTGVLSATATVYGGAECSGLASASLSGPIDGGAVALPVSGRGVTVQTVALAGDVVPGPLEFGFVATDVLGNATAAPITRTLIYDPQPPTLRGLAPESEATLVPNPEGTSQIRLALDGLDAVDPGGVVAGLAVQVTAPAAGGSTLTSPLVRIPFAQMEQVTTNADGTLSVREVLSLTQFFAPAQLLPGTYSFEIRAVDGAGNVSAESETRSEALAAITYPAWAPFVRR